MTDGDDAEARRRRAQELRRQIDEQREGSAPPRSPYEFIERETRKPSEDDEEGGGENAEGEDDPPPA